jgi:hypothetical protein
MTMTSKALRTVLFALAAGLLLSTPASATRWVGTFDPISVFGTGTFQWNDDLNCNTPGRHFATDDDPPCDPLIIALTATITDDNNTPSDTSDDSHAFLDFASILSKPLDSYDLNGGSQLVGVTTEIFGHVFPTSVDGPNGSSLDGPWWFQWISDHNEDPVNFFLGSCFEDECGFNPDVPTVQSTDIVFTQVPEPATLGLLLGGVGAAWFARRRKRA